MLPFTRAIRNTIECTLREHSIVMNRVFALLPASAEHPAQHSRAAADHQCSKKVITDILKTVIDYQSQSRSSGCRKSLFYYTDDLQRRGNAGRDAQLTPGEGQRRGS